jgi:hypothetical protein
MSATNKSNGNMAIRRREQCGFTPAHKQLRTAENDCRCVPKIEQDQCGCHKLSNKRTTQLLHKFAKTPHGVSLVAYVRTNGSKLNRDEQMHLMQEYCLEHNYQIIKTFEDTGKPSFGLEEALETLGRVDGLIAVDIDRFVEHPRDRLRDLRPFVHHFFCHTNKHLITIREGIDTGSLSGQSSAVELITQPKDTI